MISRIPVKTVSMHFSDHCVKMSKGTLILTFIQFHDNDTEIFTILIWIGISNIDVAISRLNFILWITVEPTTARIFLRDHASIHALSLLLKPSYNGHLSTSAS